jgi:hypothetical protein
MAGAARLRFRKANTLCTIRFPSNVSDFPRRHFLCYSTLACSRSRAHDRRTLKPGVHQSTPEHRIVRRPRSKALRRPMLSGPSGPSGPSGRRPDAVPGGGSPPSDATKRAPEAPSKPGDHKLMTCMLCSRLPRLLGRLSLSSNMVSGAVRLGEVPC